ncbi:hypothetical protein BG003_002885 [Podila horticola]|nr:hypothetical protein BG003_002885 [Podila horticola]
MRFLSATVALVCVIASSTAIVTRDLPFTDPVLDLYKDNQKTYSYCGVSRCEFPKATSPTSTRAERALPTTARYNGTRCNHCQPNTEVHDLTSIEFVKVTTALCSKSNGFLMIEQGPCQCPAIGAQL